MVESLSWCEGAGPTFTPPLVLVDYPKGRFPGENMKRTALLLVVAAMLLPATGLRAEDATTLTGEYVWTHRDAGDALEAVFIPAGEAKWNVAFHFNFRDKPHTYSGTAEGSLSEGKLEGEVRNESKERLFVFSGQFENGKFEGTHAEIRDGGKRDTGTLTLSGSAE